MNALHLPRLRRPVLTVGHVAQLLMLGTVLFWVAVIWFVRHALG